MMQPFHGAAPDSARDRCDAADSSAAAGVVAGALLGAAALGALAAVVWSVAPESGAAMHASHSTRWDTDGDGLPTILEPSLGASPDLEDSDGDGFFDGEEFARGTALDKAFLVPAVNEISIGMAAFIQDQELRALAAVYVPDGDFSGMNLELGFDAGNRPRLLPPQTYMQGTNVQEIPVSMGAGKVFYFDLPLSLGALKTAPNGQMSYFTRISTGSDLVAAAAIRLSFVDGAVLQIDCIGGCSTQTQPNRVATFIQRPVGGSPIPDGWVSGSLCFQQVEVVGFAGPVVKQEVVAAGCQDGWDGYCDPAGCDASVGTTFETLDPGVLIGG